MASISFSLSVSSRNRHKGADRILKLGEPAVVPCDLCFAEGKRCVVMMSSKKKLTCSECRRRGRSCVSLS